LYGILIKT